MNRRDALLVAACAGALVVAGCAQQTESGDTGSTAETPAGSLDSAPEAVEFASTTTPGSSAHRVVIRMLDDMTFDPPVARIAAGDTVVWTNEGEMPHTATGDPAKAGNPEHAALPDGATTWDSGLLQSGETYQRVFTVPRDYIYLCWLHEALGMVGRLEVWTRSEDAGGS